MIKEKASVEYVRSEMAKLAPVELKCDLSLLSISEKQVLGKLIEAGKIIDKLFLLQVDPDNLKIREALLDSKDHLEMFDIMFGSWNRLEHEMPFINNKEKPKGAGFYPENMTKQEFTDHIKNNPMQAAEFENTFTAIERIDGELIAKPFHEKYKDLINKLNVILNEAGDISEESTLKKYLKLRARDLLVDDYFESDMAWMDIAGNLEIVIGPYEVYEDGLFSYKGAYEAFICVVDQDASQKLDAVSNYLVDMEKNLPIPDEFKNFDRGLSSPIKVVQEVYSAGDTKAGIQTTAFNLPNDERVREAKGSKKVMLKNVARAKYDKCWIPIVNTILAEKPLDNVSFDAYFNHVLMHEVSHGLGPGSIMLEDGTETTVSKKLKELYPVIEECKADILGMYNVSYLMKKGVFDKKDKYCSYASYLGGMFRSIRFGINEAHGGAVAIQFNYLIEKGAFIETENGKLSLVESKMESAIRDLSHTVLMIQAKGDYDAAKDFVEKYSLMTPLMEKIVDNLKHLPIDIRPSYPAIEQL